jgi:O-antigen/teichoic acid export membrane protein
MPVEHKTITEAPKNASLEATRFGEAAGAADPGPAGTSGPEPATLVRNSGWGLASTIAAYVVTGGVSVYAVRTFSQAAWGRYSTALALISILTVLADLGLATLVLRNMAAHPDDEPRILGLGLRALFRTATVSAAVLVPLALLLSYNRGTIELIVVGSPLLLVTPLVTMLGAAFNARRRLMYSAQLSLMTLPMSAALSIGLIAAGVGPAALMISAVVTGALTAAGAVLLLDRRLGLRPRMRKPYGSVGLFIRQSLPIALVGGISIVYDRIDVLILARLSDAVAVAHYSVAYSVARLTWAVPSIIGAAFFPLYAKLANTSRDEAARALFLIIRIFAYLSGAIALFLTFAGHDLLVWGFGERYAGSTVPLAILGWVIVTLFQVYVLWYAILAARLERKLVAIQIAGLVVNVVANLALIPSLGPSGAALAMLLADFVNCGGQFVLVHRRIHRVPVASLVVRPLVACLPAVAAGIALKPVSPLVAGAVSAAAFAATLQLLRYVTVEEWRPLIEPALAFARRWQS